MKKLLTILLAALLALGCACAFAEGAMYDQPISFAEFTFGQTNGEIRESARYDYINFFRTYYTTRAIADPAGMMTTFMQPDAPDTVYFQASAGQREVAGYPADAMLHFICNPEDEGYLAREGNAQLFAGSYRFMVWDMDPQRVFDDLQSKLSRVYGEPNMLASSADEIWGAYDFGEANGMAEEYQRMSGEFQPMSCVVWKSSANNVMVVLNKYNQYGSDSVELHYLWIEADAQIQEYMNAGAAAGGAASDDLSGL